MSKRVRREEDESTRSMIAEKEREREKEEENVAILMRAR